MAWTKAYRRAHGKEMATDSTFDFERKRNVPIKYNRDLMKKTIVAMKRIAEIRKKREAQFYKNRCVSCGGWRDHHSGRER
jgi:large subunit ribosomal protein L24e